jgi:hypothetical protein
MVSYKILEEPKSEGKGEKRRNLGQYTSMAAK